MSRRPWFRFLFYHLLTKSLGKRGSLSHNVFICQMGLHVLEDSCEKSHMEKSFAHRNGPDPC